MQNEETRGEDQRMDPLLRNSNEKQDRRGGLWALSMRLMQCSLGEMPTREEVRKFHTMRFCTGQPPTGLTTDDQTHGRTT